MKLARLIAAGLLLFVVIGVSVPAFAADEVLNIAVPTDPDNFDPTRSVAAATAEIAFNIYEGLVKSTPDGQITELLASEWKLTLLKRSTFYLRGLFPQWPENDCCRCG